MREIQPIVVWFQTNWPEIKRVIITTIQDAWAVVKATIAVFQAGWAEFGSTILTLVRNDFQAIKGEIEGVVKVIRGVVEIVKGIAHGDWSLAWQGVKDVVSGTLGAIYSLLRGAAKNFAALLGLAAHMAGQALKAGLNALLGIASSILNRVVGVFKSAGSDIAKGLSPVTSVLSRVVGWLKQLYEWAKKAIDALSHVHVPGGGTLGGIAHAVGSVIPHASGGIFTRPTLIGSHLFGEAGPEAVLPLDSPAGREALTAAFRDALADVGGGGAGGGNTYHIHVTSLASTGRGVAQELGKIVNSSPRTPAITVVAR